MRPVTPLVGFNVRVDTARVRRDECATCRKPAHAVLGARPYCEEHYAFLASVTPERGVDPLEVSV